MMLNYVGVLGEALRSGWHLAFSYNAERSAFHVHLGKDFFREDTSLERAVRLLCLDYDVSKADDFKRDDQTLEKFPWMSGVFGVLEAWLRTNPHTVSGHALELGRVELWLKSRAHSHCVCRSTGELSAPNEGFWESRFRISMTYGTGSRS